MVRYQPPSNNSMIFFGVRTSCLMVQKFVRTKKSDQGWKISGKDDIYTFEEQQVDLIGNNTKIIFEMTPWKI